MKTEKTRFFCKNGALWRRLVSMLLVFSAVLTAELLLLPGSSPSYAYSENDLYRIGLTYGSYATASYSFSAGGGMQIGTNEKSTGIFSAVKSYPAGSYSVSADGSALLLKNSSGETLYRFSQSDSGSNFAAKPLAGSDGSEEFTADGCTYEGIFEFHIQDSSLGGGVAVTNILPLEPYVMCVMSREIYGSWEVEMQKVFSVAVRTYAVSRKGFHDKTYGFDLCCKTCCQTYRGNDRITDNIITGAAATKGEILTYDGKVPLINYSAISGGVMVKSSDAWGGTDYAYLDALPTPWENYGNHAPYTNHGKWTKEYTGQELYERLKNSYPALKGEIVDVHIDSFGTNSSYVTQVTVTDIYGNRAVIDHSDHVRTAFGLDSACFVVGKAGDTVTRTVYELDCFPSVLSGSTPAFTELPDVLHAKTVTRSESVTLEGREGSFVFDGSGWGHGVGLSQYGAWDMVKLGYDYRTVLAYYFKNTAILNISGELGEIGRKGDVNDDGRINASDRVELARYLAGWEGYAIDLAAGDIDGDGKVTSADRVFLARYLAGWDG